MKFRNRFLITALSVALLYVLLSFTHLFRADEKPVFSGESFRIAHRCGGGEYPENTLFACSEVVRLGISDFLEMDVRLTHDKKLVVIHDNDVSRTTDGTGNVSELLLDQIQGLDAGYKFTTDGKNYPYRGKGIRIRPLSEFFQRLPNQKYYIEIKTDAPDAADKLIELIRKYGMAEKVVVGSLHGDVQSRLHESAPELALFGSRTEVTIWAVLQKINLSGLYNFPSHALAVPRDHSLLKVGHSFIRSARKQNIRVHVWTVDKEQEMKKFINLGVDGIMTNYPSKLNSILEEMESD